MQVLRIPFQFVINVNSSHQYVLSEIIAIMYVLRVVTTGAKLSIPMQFWTQTVSARGCRYAYRSGTTRRGVPFYARIRARHFFHSPAGEVEQSASARRPSQIQFLHLFELAHNKQLALGCGY